MTFRSYQIRDRKIRCLPSYLIGCRNQYAHGETKVKNTEIFAILKP